MRTTDHYHTVIVGAGPAGLTAAHALSRHGLAPVVIERGCQVGGISRTETYDGYRFDIGGHRFFTKVAEVDALWHEILGEDFVRTDRLSRIFYGGKFYPYPLAVSNTLSNLGITESARILGSYLAAKARPLPEDNMEQWVTNRFGDRLYRTFFKTYTEKVWGIPCHEIRADWAAQRIRGVSVRKAVMKAITGMSTEASLIDAFWYPRLGPGMMWERCSDIVQALGGTVHMGQEVTALRHDGRRILEVFVHDGRGRRTLVPLHVVNSMPLSVLVERLVPAPPRRILEAARSLSYRSFLVVVLLLDRPDVFPDNWIYVHSSDVRVGRIQNFKNWSPDMVPDASTTSLGMEYFCDECDDLWNTDDADLIRLASTELERIGLGRAADVFDGTVVREAKAYPVYDATYRVHVDTIREYLERFENLQTVGRAGMHRYNNQDHSMLTALLAVRNILGDAHDLWTVNVERSYHEEFTTRPESPQPAAAGVAFRPSSR